AIRVRSEMRLKVTAANVEKFRRPRFDSIRRFGEFTRYPAATTAPHRALVDRAIGIDQLRRHKLHFAAGRTGDGDLRHVRGVLAEVEYDITVGERPRGNRFVDFEFANRR